MINNLHTIWYNQYFYIDAKVKEIETQRNMEAMHWYAIEYCDDGYFKIDNFDRDDLEKQIDKLLNGE